MLDVMERAANRWSESKPNVQPPEKICLEVWVRWNSDHTSLRAFVKPRAAVEQFSLIELEPCGRDSAVWRCAFRHVGHPVSIDHQIPSLLRRLSPTAPWVRAERKAAPEALDDDPRELDWDDFARRPLP